MAIEFDCPYCTATIRVPDAYGGKQGRCPKCDTHLLVPMVVRPGQETVPDGAPVPVALVPVALVPGVPTDASPPTEEFSFRPVLTSTPPLRRRRIRRRRSRALVIGMPVLCFLVLIAIIGYYVTSSLPELSGQFVARPLAETSLPRVTIPWSETGLSPEDQGRLQEVLARTPETLASQIMVCRLIGGDGGIEVQLTAGPESQWYVVDPTTSKPLALWLKKERTGLNQRRLSMMKSSLESYCQDKLTQIAGQPVAIDVADVRDNVGLNACGGPFSSVVEAIVGNRLVPCAYEDDRGMIYFCLPKGTLSFQIVGRTFSDRSKPFAGEYTVVVTPDSSSSRTTAPEDSSTLKLETPTESEMTPDALDEDKSNQERSGERDMKPVDEKEKEKEKEMMNPSASVSKKPGALQSLTLRT